VLIAVNFSQRRRGVELLLCVHGVRKETKHKGGAMKKVVFAISLTAATVVTAYAVYKYYEG
jgi:hypothetical protein